MYNSSVIDFDGLEGLNDIKWPPSGIEFSEVIVSLVRSKMKFLFMIAIACLLAGYLISNGSIWIERLSWLTSGPQLLSSKYTTGKPFTVQTPERNYLFVSSEEHIKELSAAKETDLSLVATAEELFQPAHTMNGVELHRLGLQHRILRNLSRRLPSYQNPLRVLAQNALRHTLSQNNCINEWQSLDFLDMAQIVVAKANAYVFFGEEFTTDDKFVNAAIRYPRDVSMAAEALRCVPKIFAPMVASLVTRRHQSSTYMMSKLVPMIAQRIQIYGHDLDKEPQDYVDWIIKLYPSDAPDRTQNITRQTLALWFASVHQPAMTLYYILVDLCDHPENFDILSYEIKENIERNGSLDVSQLSMMDSFLKESARMNASESISLRRKALVPYNFGDGTHLAVGDWVCVPQREIMRDPAVYQDARTFNGQRFCTSSEQPKTASSRTKFTDLDPKFPFWGLGKQACPGRFYAAFIMKIILVDILQHYDIKLKDASMSRTFTWRSAIVPRSRPQFSVRLKESSRWE